MVSLKKMLNRINILFWIIKNKYFLHLFYLLIFFFKKKFFRQVSHKENLSYKESRTLCKKLHIEKKRVYYYFAKLKKIHNFNPQKKYLRKIHLPRKNRLGGGSDTELLYNLISITKPKNIIEFGVANGWSTIAILEACKKNKTGNLTSIDMPYYFNNARSMIANLLNKNRYENWYLFIGPQVNFFKIMKKKYDFCHYDSDKSYQGRMIAYEKIWNNLNKKGIFLSDDISDNMAFFDFCNLKKKKPFFIKYKKKFLGIIIR